MITLSPFCAEYTAALIPFVVSFWGVHHDSVSDDDARDMLKEWSGADGHRLFVICGDERRPLGFLHTHIGGTVCWIDDIYVDMPYRRRGVAKAAIGLLETACSAEGCRSFCMDVVPDNIPAMRLYYSLGYDRLSLITMRKDLDGFEVQRTETVGGLEMKVRKFD